VRDATGWTWYAGFVAAIAVVGSLLAVCGDRGLRAADRAAGTPPLRPAVAARDAVRDVATGEETVDAYLSLHARRGGRMVRGLRPEAAPLPGERLRPALRSVQHLLPQPGGGAVVCKPRHSRRCRPACDAIFSGTYIARCESRRTLNRAGHGRYWRTWKCIGWFESRWDRWATGAAGEASVYQVHPVNWHLFRGRDPYNVEANTLVAVELWRLAGGSWRPWTTRWRCGGA
jgi:hypothetical protein